MFWGNVDKTVVNELIIVNVLTPNQGNIPLLKINL